MENLFFLLLLLFSGFSSCFCSFCTCFFFYYFSSCFLVFPSVLWFFANVFCVFLVFSWFFHPFSVFFSCFLCFSSCCCVFGHPAAPPPFQMGFFPGTAPITTCPHQVLTGNAHGEIPSGQIRRSMNKPVCEGRGTEWRRTPEWQL